MEIKKNYQNINKIHHEYGKINNKKVDKSINKGLTNKTFSDIINKELGKQNKEVIFSKHANSRISTRNIKMDKARIQTLEKGINKAREKGIKESLILADNVAYVVSIKNNIVVTAMDKDEVKEHIFTNIDGAVIM